MASNIPQKSPRVEFERALNGFSVFHKEYEELRKGEKLKNLIASIRGTIFYFIQDLEAKNVLEFDPKDVVTSLRNDVVPLEQVLKEDAAKLLVATLKAIQENRQN